MLAINNLRKYSRYQAATGHLVLSLLVLGVLGYLVYFCWYPQPLFSIDAGWQGLRILAFVDIVLGPCITLVIFNPKKKELFKDVAIIALIQISALSYGVYHVYQSRPALIVYADNQFKTVALSQLEFHNLPDTITGDIPLLGPKFLFLDIPREDIVYLDEIELTKENLDIYIPKHDNQRIVLKEARKEGRPYYLVLKRLKNYKKNLQQLAKYKVSEADLYQNPESRFDAETFLEKHKDAFSIASVDGRFGQAIVALNKKGEFIDYLQGSYVNHWLAK